MKRYHIYATNCAEIDQYEDPEGEWVRFEDVRGLLEDASKLLKAIEAVGGTRGYRQWAARIQAEIAEQR